MDKKLPNMNSISNLPGNHGLFVDGDWVETKDQDENGDIRLIQLADIGDGEFRNRSDRFMNSATANRLGCTFLEQGDVLVARMPDPLGRSCVFPLLEKKKYVTVVDIAIIRPDNKTYDSRYISHIINAPQVRSAISSLESGTTRKRISRKNLGTVEIPTPPIEQQQKVIAKLDELFSELDKSVASLKKAQEQLKVYRQAVLKAAFDGKLTHIHTSKTSVKVKDVADTCLGKMLDEKKNKGALYPYLGNINVRWGHFDLDNLKKMRFEESEHSRYSLLDGDLVICEGGEPGRAAIWTDKKAEIKIQKALHRVRFSNNISTKYFYYYLIFIASTNALERYFTGTTIKHLPGEKLKEIEFPLYSKKDQDAIAIAIEDQFRSSDKLSLELGSSVSSANTLRQSILKSAFEGRLL